MDKNLIKYRVAVATSDGIVVNQHFGKADKFRIYDINQDNTIDFREERKVEIVCQGGVHDDLRLKENINYLLDCKYVLVSKIGLGAVNTLEQANIRPMEIPGIIEESIKKLIVYDEIQALLL